MKIERLVQRLKEGRFGGSLSFEHEIASTAGKYAPLSVVRSPIMQGALQDMGIDQLYAHQAESYVAVSAGENVIITTPTASGKSLCYNIPVVESIYHDRSVRAIYFFPMKALGHDQVRALEKLLDTLPLGGGISVAVLDGDTDKRTRQKLAKNPPNILITNPDILHFALLAGNATWHGYLKSVKYLVVDELHAYRGIFASHIHNLFTRFFRINPDVQLITCSATIGNPKTFPEELFGRPFTHIGTTGAPTGKKHFLLLNPDEASRTGMAASILKTAVECGVKTICFTKSRIHTELIYSRLLRDDGTLSSRISSYRAGFLPEERRDIERAFADGSLSAVVSTSAFELGIDIGGIDCTLLVGYPGSLMSLWQRAGRAGRKQNDSLVILIAGQDALDQYYAANPQLLLSGAFEEVTVDRENEEVNRGHILCAALEKPVHISEPYYASHRQEIDYLVSRAELFTDIHGETFHTLKQYPYQDVDLRNAGETYTVTCMQQVIATNSARRAYTELFTGAVYLHRGSMFIVESTDRANNNIIVKPFSGNYMTSALTDKQTTILEELDSVQDKGLACQFARLLVLEQLVGYNRTSIRTGEKLTTIPLNEEPVQFETKGVALVIPSAVAEAVTAKGYNFMGSIHAMEHALIAMLPSFILAARDDIAGISYPMHPQLGSPAIFIYDGHPGGAGITKRIYPKLRAWLARTADMIAACTCDTGCPSCIYSPKCGSGNYPLDKAGAHAILTSLLEAESIEIPPVVIEPANEPVTEETTQLPFDTVVFDLETKHLADEVGGWGNAHKMGMSVGVLYSVESDEFEVYLEQDVLRLIDRLTHAKLVVGFNTVGFDYKVLSGYREINLKEIPSLDLLMDIRSITGKRFSLENIAQATLHTGKSGSGTDAITWLRNGELAKVVEYCRMDVELTAKLLKEGAEKGSIFATLPQGAVIRIPVLWSRYF